MRRKRRNNYNRNFNNNNNNSYGQLVPIDRDYIEWTSNSSGTGAYTFPVSYRGRQIKMISLELSLAAVKQTTLVEITFFGSSESFSTKDIIVTPSLPKRIVLRSRRAADFLSLSTNSDDTAFVINTSEDLLVVAVGQNLIRPLRNNPSRNETSPNSVEKFQVDRVHIPRKF